MAGDHPERQPARGADQQAMAPSQASCAMMMALHQRALLQSVRRSPLSSTAAAPHCARLPTKSQPTPHDGLPPASHSRPNAASKSRSPVPRSPSTEEVSL